MLHLRGLDGGGGGGGAYTFLYQALLVVLFWLAFPSVSSKCAFHICHSLWQGGFTHNHKQEVNRLKIPPGSLHTIVSLVE